MPAPGPGRNRVRERFGRIVERLTSPSLLAYAVSGGAAIASFIATVILARTSGPETVGHYADSDDAGHPFRSDAGHHSDLIPAGRSQIAIA